MYNVNYVYYYKIYRLVYNTKRNNYVNYFDIKKIRNIHLRNLTHHFVINYRHQYMIESTLLFDAL